MKKNGFAGQAMKLFGGIAAETASDAAHEQECAESDVLRTYGLPISFSRDCTIALSKKSR